MKLLTNLLLLFFFFDSALFQGSDPSQAEAEGRQDGPQFVEEEE